jgi:hypothetical protein
LWAWQFFAFEDFCMTERLFDVQAGRFFYPGTGIWWDCFPGGFIDPITVLVTEVVEAQDADGTVDYEQITVCYNACWDEEAHGYCYYDRVGDFHWLSFPWLDSWGVDEADSTTD